MRKEILEEISLLEKELLLKNEFHCDENLKNTYKKAINPIGVSLTIQAGPGGIEAQAWAKTMLRMYTRFARRHSYKCHLSDSESAQNQKNTIKKATLIFDDPRAAASIYKKLEKETGVHRITRVSPFDAQGRRHTSFASVEIVALYPNEEKTLAKKDLRVETMRASGPGGQNVNKTSKAVRITHLPTGISAKSQTRSLHQNHQEALKVLAARVKKHLEKQTADKRVVKETGWGQQIRSYIFVPHQFVKDHRTGKKVGQLQRVLDGELELLYN